VISNGDEVTANSQIPSISNEGRYVAFESEGALDPDDDNGVFDIYVHDFKTGKTVLASRTADGGLADMESHNPQISNDGRFVTWDSIATFTDDDDFGFAVDDDVWVRDLKRNQTLRASLDSNGDEAEATVNANSREPSISGNGRYVTFEAEFDAPFIDTDLNMRSDIYVKDMKTGKLTRASLTSQGDETAEDSFEQDEAPLDAISADGRFVVWETDGAYVGNDHNDTRDVYMRDMKTKKTIRLTLKSNGKEVDTYPNQLASISADGKFVAFVSMAKFTNPDAGTDFDVFVRGPLK
jgi:Tol biopolymer transport system component